MKLLHAQLSHHLSLPSVHAARCYRNVPNSKRRRTKVYSSSFQMFWNLISITKIQKGWESVAVSSVTNKVKISVIFNVLIIINKNKYNITYIPLPSMIWIPHDRHIQWAWHNQWFLYENLHSCIQTDLLKSEQ
jgi:hypothetical protein